MIGAGVVVWFTGLPASGKSTLAARVRARLRRASVVLDSDEIRTAIEAESYDPYDRDRFYRVLAKLAAGFARQGLVVLVAATAPRRAHRERARALTPNLLEVWVRTPVSECAQRDVKGLYARAAAGAITSLPGAGSDYETPVSPDFVAEGGFDDEAAVAIQRRLE